MMNCGNTVTAPCEQYITHDVLSALMSCCGARLYYVMFEVIIDLAV